MTRGLALVRDFFVAPAAAVPRESAVPVPPVVVVLGHSRIAFPAACAAALDLARGGVGAHAAVCLWPPGAEAAPRTAATLPARRVAARLAGRGCEADASGRLARVRLPAPPPDALAAAQRAAAAADCPLSIALGAPRTPELDTLLALADAAILARHAGDAPAVARLAEAGLARLGVPAIVWRPRLGPAGRLLATTGLAAPASARAALATLR